MLLLGLALLALLATSGVWSGSPRYTGGKWALYGNLQSQATEEQSLDSEEDYWPDAELEMVNLVSLEDQNFLTTPESYVVTEQDREEGDAAVWKVALVAVVLLVSILGCLSLAYYMCVWRGGRVHYQKASHAFI